MRQWRAWAAVHRQRRFRGVEVATRHRARLLRRALTVCVAVATSATHVITARFQRHILDWPHEPYFPMFGYRLQVHVVHDLWASLSLDTLADPCESHVHLHGDGCFAGLASLCPAAPPEAARHARGTRASARPAHQTRGNAVAKGLFPHYAANSFVMVEEGRD